MSGFQPGDIVRITIDARVAQPRAGQSENDLTIQYRAELGMYEGTIAIDSEAVKVERTAPPDWPPRPGDLWRDRHGTTWFAFYGIDAREVFMVPADPVSGPLSTPQPDVVLSKVGPLTLVHREEAEQ